MTTVNSRAHLVAKKLAIACALLLLLAFATRGHSAGIEVALQVGHSSPPRAIALSHNGLWLASGDVRLNLILWELATGREIRAQKTIGTGISAIAFSPDDRHVAVGDYDGSVRVLETESGREVALLKGGLHQVMALAWRGTGSLQVHHKMSLAEWSTLDWRRIGEIHLELHPGVVDQGSFAGSGRFLLAIYRSWKKDEQRSFVIDSRSGKVLLESAHGDAALAADGDVPILYVKDGERLLRKTSGSDDFNLLSPNSDVKLHDQSVLAVSPNGRSLFVDSLGATLIIDTRTKATTTLAESTFLVANVPVAMSNTHVVFVGGLASGMRAVKLPGVHDPIVTRDLGGQASPAIGALFTRGEDTLLIANSAPFATGLFDRMAPPHGRWSHLDTSNWSVREVFQMASGMANNLAVLKSTIGSSLTVGFSSGPAHFITRPLGASKPVLLAPPAAEAQEGSPFNIRLTINCPGSISEDGRIGAVARPTGVVTLWNLSSGQLMGNIGNYDSLQTTFDFGPTCIVQSLALSPDGRFLAVSNSSNVKLDIWSTRDFKLVGGIDAPFNRDPKIASLIAFRSLAFSPKGDVIAAASDTRTRLYSFPGLKQLQDFGDRSGSRRVVFSPDGKWLASTKQDGTITVWNLAGGDAPTELRGHTDTISGIAISSDSRFLVSTSWDGTARIWDLKKARLLAQYISFNDGEWVLVTPEGYFTASQRGPAQLNFRQGMRLYTLNEFYDVFYRPDIVQAKLRGEEIAPMIGITIDDALQTPPPLVELTLLPSVPSGRIRVKYSVRSTGGGIGDIRVYHNGKLAHSDGESFADHVTERVAIESVTAESMRSLQRGATVSARRPGLRQSSQRPDLVQGEVELDPSNGENEVGVIAFNRDNRIQSDMALLGIRAERTEEPARMHILAVGVNRYRAPEAELKRAVDDARAFGTRVASAALSYFAADRIELNTLTDEQATRERILAEFERIVEKAQPQDLIVVFVAAHGVIDAGRYALVTHDYNGRLGSEALISAASLIAISQRARALNQLFVIDTCYAGGLGNALSAYYDSRLSLFARNAGVHVFAGASDHQGAVDDYEGNGLFTHVLLKGMTATEADKNADGQISIVELGSYANQEARRIAGLKQVMQAPVVRHYGRDRAFARLFKP